MWPIKAISVISLNKAFEGDIKELLLVLHILQ